MSKGIVCSLVASYKLLGEGITSKKHNSYGRVLVLPKNKKRWIPFFPGYVLPSVTIVLFVGLWCVECTYRFGVWICLPIGFHHSKKVFWKGRLVETKIGFEIDKYGIYYHNVWL